MERFEVQIRNTLQLLYNLDEGRYYESENNI